MYHGVREKGRQSWWKFVISRYTQQNSYNFVMEGPIVTKLVAIDDGPLLKMPMQKLSSL